MRRINDRLLSWASILDPATEEQAKLTAALPFIHPHVALMPDAHLGLGATVGSVIPTRRSVIPAAVGVDIGCGMIAVRTQFGLDDVAARTSVPGGTLRRLRERIERAIPLSAGGRNRRIEPTAEPRIRQLERLGIEHGFDPASYSDTWALQLGSLGSGNHFIEVSLDETDAVWLFLHSGSRGIGNRIAQHHIGIARRAAEREGLHLADRDLAHLEEGTPQFTRYISELRWAQHFALLNREEMMDRVVREFSDWVGQPVTERERINCHHNFTEESVQSGERVWLSRKGAIPARLGEPGLIPGSMGTASYVVEGLGNELALESAPHGAGRAYSRNAARRTFTHQQLREAMTGIEFRDTPAFLDEIPAAYKPIDQVMADAGDLVRVTHTLRQIVNVKGD